MREFTWCRQELAEDCRVVGDHAHIVIASPEGRRIIPWCRKMTLRIFFYDLDPAAIRRTPAFAKGPVQGQKLIDGCFTQEHAQQIARFVQVTKEDEIFIVNCEAGISRSPGVVLALRRKFGGDTEEVFKKAYPNIHVASTLGHVLGVGPFQSREYDGIVNPFESGEKGITESS